MYARAALLLLALLVQAPAPAPPAAPPATPEVLKRPAVIGASMSAGFGLQREAKRPLDLADVLGEVLLVATEHPLDGASSGLFLDPERISREKVDELLAEEPTVLFGVDFLFWFAYGRKTTEEQHLARFERGLALLDRFPCPLVLGDLPDMSIALDAPVKMISASQVPEKAILARLNARLAEWAAERPRVCLVPLSSFVARVVAGERLELRGNTWEDAVDRLLLRDHLHPTLEGTVGVALLALDALDRARADVTPEMIAWDVQAAVAHLVPAPAPAPATPAAAEGKVR
jgi:hypothetical protein